MPPPDGYGYTSRGNFYDTLTAAVADITEHGFDSSERVAIWMQRLREAAIASMIPQHRLQEVLTQTFRAVYRDQVERGRILRHHAGIARFTLEKVKPQLRSELDRRIMAAAELTKLNRDQAIETTLRRFSGWATSIPAGGSDAVDRRGTKAEIKKSLASLPFAERRVAVDQGHKFAANLSEILAVDGGALVGQWNSNFRQKNYDARPEHKHFDLDDQIFVVPDNWALRAGLMKLDGHRYISDVERPGQLPFCRCWYTWVHSLRSLPADMLTAKGRAELDKVRIAA